MRIIFAAVPLQGHLLPMVPLAAACRDAGHDVLLASGGFPPDVCGLRTADIGARFSLMRSALRVMVRHPGLTRAEMRGVAGTRMAGELFARANMSVVEPLQALAERERPDLIVFESLTEAGALVAGRLGVPSVLQENTLWPASDLFRAVTTSFKLARMGVTAPSLVLAVTPPSLRADSPTLTGPGGASVPAMPLRSVPFSGGGPVPPWLAERGERPRIVVSRSTLDGPNDGDPGPAVVAAAAELDAEIVLVRPEVKGDLPGNVRRVGRVPLDAVLPYADAFVHHAGAGSMLGGLAAGLPQLVTSGAGDRRFNAELLTRRGAGLQAEAKAITAADLTRLLTDASLRTAAQEVAAEIAAMPAPATVVPHLEKLVG